MTKVKTAAAPRKSASISNAASKEALPIDAIFMVDGTIPSGSFDDAVFLADYLADTRNRPVEIRRTVPVPDAADVYVRKPRDVDNREQINCHHKYVVLDGDRVVFKGGLVDTMAFAKGRGAGVVCGVYLRTVSVAQQLEDDESTVLHLKGKLRCQENDIQQLRLKALQHGLKTEVRAFDRMCSKLAKVDHR